jgi:hypothetical protein
MEKTGEIVQIFGTDLICQEISPFLIEEFEWILIDGKNIHIIFWLHKELNKINPQTNPQYSYIFFNIIFYFVVISYIIKHYLFMAPSFMALFY